jgi:hypothetical protein
MSWSSRSQVVRQAPWNMYISSSTAIMPACTRSTRSHAGFKRHERDALRGVVESMGARFSPDLVHRSTAPGCFTTTLVCKRLLDAFGTPKYTRALEWGLPVVTWSWLVDCMEQRRLLPTFYYKTDRLDCPGDILLSDKALLLAPFASSQKTPPPPPQPALLGPKQDQKRSALAEIHNTSSHQLQQQQQQQQVKHEPPSKAPVAPSPSPPKATTPAAAAPPAPITTTPAAPVEFSFRPPARQDSAPLWPPSSSSRPASPAPRNTPNHPKHPNHQQQQLPGSCQVSPLPEGYEICSPSFGAPAGDARQQLGREEEEGWEQQGAVNGSPEAPSHHRPEEDGDYAIPGEGERRTQPLSIHLLNLLSTHAHACTTLITHTH